jgi:hypothetical protein
MIHASRGCTKLRSWFVHPGSFSVITNSIQVPFTCGGRIKCFDVVSTICNVTRLFFCVHTVLKAYVKTMNKISQMQRIVFLRLDPTETRKVVLLIHMPV